MARAQDREASTLRHEIVTMLERVVATLDGLDEASMNWRPPAAGANSLHVVAVHTLANAEENICHAICGDAVERRRDEEFATAGAPAVPLRERWAELRTRIEACLSGLTDTDLGEERRHQRRGMLPVREFLLITLRHAAEHAGQAELTRDLLRGPDIRPMS